MRTTKHIKSKQIIELRKHMALLKMVLHLVNAIYYKLGNDYCKAIKNNITSIIKNDPEYAVKYYHPLFINDNADVYIAPTATTARTFCHTLPLTAHGHCPVKYDILDIARQ